MKKALITGIAGQDGAFLAAELLGSGYEVYGAFRRGGNPKIDRLNVLKIANRVRLVSVEISDLSNVLATMSEIRPDLVFNLAAQSFVQDSFMHPTLTTQVNYFGALNFLESIRLLGIDCKFFQASSSEIFGNADISPQDENTQYRPLSPYAIAKCAAHQLVGVYRANYGMYASSGILFNHESELRGREFVTRKISSQMAEIALGRKKPIELGNLNSARDWGYARDYVRGMKVILESDKPGDYVLATNTSSTVREFLSATASYAGFRPHFEGEGLDERCIDLLSGRVLCSIDKRFFRSIDVESPRGDFSKIFDAFGWEPTTSLNEMAELMVKFDLDRLTSNGYIG
jgi:GDPmannose 4,6-dehydratase